MGPTRHRMGRDTGHPHRQAPMTALAANTDGEIFEVDGYAAVGMAGGQPARLTRQNTIALPYGSELLRLPDRYPVFYNLRTRRFEVVRENPYAAGEPIYPVAAFNSPGYLNVQVCAYEASARAEPLPLFAYAAAGWQAGIFRTAAIRVDAEKRQDLRHMPPEGVVAGIRLKRRTLSRNRLLRHLAHCAQTYGCPAAKNFFLQRFEAPLPTAQHCNARCLGCLSLQTDATICCSQHRIEFTPTAEEIAEIALSHLFNVDRGVVSFGQGCEGDPLLACAVIEPAIRHIRSRTDRGTIHMNTNASRPEPVARLCAAGLDSMRVSINSFQPECYHAYFRPVNYDFDDVMASIATALQKGRFVSINYLNCPGFTDTAAELTALTGFLKRYPIHMIQWRNLNYDPQRYWHAMSTGGGRSQPLGMKRVVRHVRRAFPSVRHGYFNPPKETFYQANRQNPDAIS